MKNIIRILAAVLVPLCLMTACQQAHRFELTDGVPTIKYIRLQDASVKDSLITEAALSTPITILGENLTSIKEMYFNDQKVVLNTSLITSYTMLITIPKNIPGEVNDLITMKTNDGQTVTYPFHVTVPGPVIYGLPCEYAKDGELITLNGQYFVDDPNVPLSVAFVGVDQSLNVEVSRSEMKGFTQGTISFYVPAGAPEGQIKVTTIYGTALSPFFFKDKRGLLTDFDGDGNASSVNGMVPQGWNLAPVYSDVDGIDGFYCQVGPEETDGGWIEPLKLSFWCGNWGGDPMSITSGAGVPVRNVVDMTDWQNMSFKFELCIPSSNPWSAGALQVIFANNQDCANDSWQNNNYIKLSSEGGLDLPRGLYNPWAASGSFDTGDQWITVTMPLKDFVYNWDGTKAGAPMTIESFDSFTIWPVAGGVNGDKCSPILRYDNLRLVPNL